SRLGAARVQQLLAQLCDKAGLGGKADRYRQAAINEMRNLGDRRATAEMLLNDTPTRSALVMGRLDDAVQLTKEIGWAEGHEHAKRKAGSPVKPYTTHTERPASRVTAPRARRRA